MCNKDLRDEMRIANVRQWEVAEAIGISEMTMVKWLRKELDDSNDKNDPHWCLEYMGDGHYFDTAQQLMDYYASRKFKKSFGPSL